MIPTYVSVMSSIQLTKECSGHTSIVACLPIQKLSPSYTMVPVLTTLIKLLRFLMIISLQYVKALLIILFPFTHAIQTIKISRRWVFHCIMWLTLWTAYHLKLPLILMAFRIKSSKRVALYSLHAFFSYSIYRSVSLKYLLLGKWPSLLQSIKRFQNGD